jgi:parvulin-like peptidyl-prolyl cis-trans isomerase-like protein
MSFSQSLVLISLFIVQSFPATAQTAAKVPESGPPATVDRSQPVITIHGLCSEGASKTGKGTCTKIITREEFEKLMNALNPGGQPISQEGRQNFGRTYADFLAYEAAARSTGLEDTAEFRQIMDWVRLRTIADLYRRNLQEKFRNPTQEEIDAYYQQHLPSFERVKIARILVPRENPAVGADKNEFDKKALDAANTAHQRAAKGEDTAQIQKDVYAALGLSGPPPTDLGSYARANFMEKEAAEVFALKPGEVTGIQSEPRNYVIYKVLSKETLSKDQARAEITRDISQQKFRDALKAITDSAHPDFNEEYFGPGMATPQLNPPAVPRLPRH